MVTLGPCFAATFRLELVYGTGVGLLWGRRVGKLYFGSVAGGLVACAALGVAHFALREPMPTVPATPQILFRPAQSLAPELNERRYAPDDKIALIQDLQRNLQRLGCYDGTVNGVWTPATRDAMRAFIERVNARLPTDQPDEFLLNLAASHEKKACVDKSVYAAAAPVPASAKRRSAAPTETGAIEKRDVPATNPASSGASGGLPTFVPVAGLESRIEADKTGESNQPPPVPTVYATPVKTAAVGGDQDLIADWLEKGTPSRATTATVAAANSPEPARALPSVSVQQASADEGPVADGAAPRNVTVTFQPEDEVRNGEEAPPKAKPRKRLRAMKNYSKPPKFVKSIMRDVQSAMSSLGLY